MSLQDKVGYAVLGDFQMDQHHLMLNFYWRAPDEAIYGHKKVCLEQNISIGLHYME